jgi:PKHD-type hydroxylase
MMDTVELVDGVTTAGPAAASVKQNVEVSEVSPEFQRMCTLITDALTSSQALEYAVMPVNSTRPIFARYTAGMSYGEHLDVASSTYMPGALGPVWPGRFRSDVSASIFLSQPEEYEGGELVANTPAGIRSIKGQAGSMVTYPSGYLHHINEVTSGVRRVVVLWFQCYIRDPERRTMIYQLMNSAGNLMGRYPDDPDVKTMNYVYNNLVRMWGDVS